MKNLVEVKVSAVLFDVNTNTPVVVLRDLEGKKVLLIWVGAFEASAIEIALEGLNTPRPMTHDLLKNALEELNAKVVKISIHDLKENTFLATISLNFDGKTMELDSRPSDAIALALRTKSPIYAVDWMLKDSPVLGESYDADEKEQFKQFLDSLKPEDFRYKQ